MTDRIHCPVCQYARIPRDMDVCPQCDADLTCFRLLDRLSDIPPAPAPSSFESATKHLSTFGDMPADREIHLLESNEPAGSHQRLISLALMVLTLVLVGFFIFFTYRLSAVEHLLQRQHTALMDLVTSDSSSENDLQKKNPVLQAIPDRKKQTPVAIQPILIISEALETNTGSKVIEIDME
jgi:hypothetical protein